MTLHPGAQAVLDLIAEAGRPSFEEMSVPDCRDAYVNSRKALQPDPIDVAEVRNLIMPGEGKSLEELIGEVEDGVLITRLWYLRMVQPQTLLYTGLTRDGTFFIEDGKIAFPIQNMRFNESPIIMLNNIEALGKPVRTGGNLIPPMKIRDFTFTSLSDAV